MLRNIFSRLFRRRKSGLLNEFKDAELERGELESKAGGELYREIWSGNYVARRQMCDSREEASSSMGGYFCLQALPEPKQDSSLYLMWEAYMGKNSVGWIERLMMLEGMAGATKLNSEAELQYVKKVKENLYGFSKNGYLLIEINNRTETKDAIERAFNSLDTLIQLTENRLGQNHSKRAYAYSNA